MSLNIRPIVQADRDAWHRLWTAYLHFYGTALPETTFASAFARLTGEDPRFSGFLAMLDDVPVGLVHLIFDESFWHPEGRIYLQDLYVDPDIRGKGVGRALIEAVYSAADVAGRPNVWWLTQDFNATARELYDRIGVKTPFIKYNRAG
ncbi:MAG: GNAT family N-acetyltransferase [Deltaproteobacteria bacterium]